MKFISTRGATEPVGFRDGVMMGMARDGGLLIPETIPDVRNRLAAWRDLSYQDLAFEILHLFTDVPESVLREWVDRSYREFRHPEITPVVPVGGLHILELFHGPTLAFKDVALQFLGWVFEHILGEGGGALNILGATSGDTGSAAISGVRGRERIRIFMMHPDGKTSEIQKRQMTSVLDSNVFNMAVRGTFDDCQSIMKTLFADLPFKDGHALGSVNSINVARLLAQIVYYFYAAFRVMASTGAQAVRFSVPTGNFGDVLAGYLAARMGLPVRRLILATNENDILARFFAGGVYTRGPVHATLSPSMDIQVASNFERYVYYRVGENPKRLRSLMKSFARTGSLSLSRPADGHPDPLFASGVGDTAATLETIRSFDARHGYLLDPHTAVGVSVALRQPDDGVPTICLATAHPAKFADAIRQAVGRDAAHHPILDALKDLPTRCETLPASPDAVRAYITART
jgi:threonine synthase